MSILGVVMAGGRNTRFGDIKAFARVGPFRVIDSPIFAVEANAGNGVLITNDPAAYAAAGLEMRGDLIRNKGPLGGIHAALHWAKERGDEGIAVAACDMPFASPFLLELILEAAPSYDVVLPESDSRRGVEPLFGYYAVSCLPAIEAAIARDDLRMIGFHEDLDVYRIPLDEVREFGDPEVLFMNVNTLDDLTRAENMLRRLHK